MDRYKSTRSSESSEWRASHPRHTSIGSSAQNSETESILISFRSPLSSPTSQTSQTSQAGKSPQPNSRPTSTSSDQATHLALRPAVTISFARGNRLFKLRYSHVDVYRDATGDLKSIVLSDYSRAQGSLVHRFPNSRQVIPHLEQPAASEKAALRVSFLGTQTIQTAQTLFSAEPCYTFEDEKDCIQFQEALLQQQVVLIAGVAELKSKGRGEECISQNLRILRSPAGAFGMFYFANSQRKEKKRYVSIPMSAVDRIEPGKKGSKSISIRLRPTGDLLAQLKSLQIKFLEESEHATEYFVRSSAYMQKVKHFVKLALALALDVSWVLKIPGNNQIPPIGSLLDIFRNHLIH